MPRPVSFEDALYEMKLGRAVARDGWNGKNMWVFRVPEGTIQVPHKMGGGYPTVASLWMKTVDNRLVPWLASQTDLLADDWMVVENPLRAEQITHHA